MNLNIATLNSDGTGFLQLTSNRPDQTLPRDYSPQFSPNGKQIAFVQITGSWPEIHVMNVDGSNEHVAFNSMDVEYPSFSPNRSQIVYQSMGDVADHFYQGIAIVDLQDPKGIAPGYPRLSKPNDPKDTLNKHSS